MEMTVSSKNPSEEILKEQNGKKAYKKLISGFKLNPLKRSYIFYKF